MTVPYQPVLYDQGLRLVLVRIMAVNNGKGGVGKTSLTTNIAANRAKLHAMAGTGARTLIVDMDHQGDLGDDLGYNMLGLGDDGRLLAMGLQGYADLGVAMVEAHAALAAHRADPAADQSFLAHVGPGMGFLADVRPGLDVIVGGRELQALGGALASRQMRGEDIRLVLARALAPLAPHYDAIFLDTPPSDEQMQTLALAAARWLLVPVQPDAASIKNIAKVAELIGNLRDVNPDLEVAGIVLFDFPPNATNVRTKAERQIKALIEGTGIPIFTTAIRQGGATAQRTREDGLLPFEQSGHQAEDLATEYLAVTTQFNQIVTAREAELAASAAGES